MRYIAIAIGWLAAGCSVGTPAGFSAGDHWTFPLVGPIGVHLDHLFFSLPEGCRAAVSRMNDRWGSDHYPMLGSIAAP